MYLPVVASGRKIKCDKIDVEGACGCGMVSILEKIEQKKRN